MKDIYNIKCSSSFCIIKIILFQLIIISQSQKVDTIIQLGDKGLRYSHFSFNSNGDMIIDTTSFPVNKNRYFFGLKQNGKFYFKKADNSETPYYTMEVDYDLGRIEGESYLIKLSSNDSHIHGKEFICGISKHGDNNRGKYVDLYNLEDKNYTKYEAERMFGNIYSESFIITKAPNESDSNNYYYLVSYIEKSDNKYYKYLRKIYFSFENSQGYYLSREVVPEEVEKVRSIGGFFTEKSKYISIYLSKNTGVKIKAYNSIFTQVEESLLYNLNNLEERIFFKGIHLKGEI